MIWRLFLFFIWTLRFDWFYAKIYGKNSKYEISHRTLVGRDRNRKIKIEMDMNMNTTHCDGEKTQKRLMVAKLLPIKLLQTVHKNTHTHLNTLEHTRAHTLMIWKRTIMNNIKKTYIWVGGWVWAAFFPMIIDWMEEVCSIVRFTVGGAKMKNHLVWSMTHETQPRWNERLAKSIGYKFA